MSRASARWNLGDTACGRSEAALQIASPYRLGLLYVLSVPIAAVLANTPGIEIGGFQVTGWVWVGYAILGMTILLAELGLHPGARIAFPFVPWCLWFGYVFLSLAWAQHAGRVEIQQACQLSMPLLIGVIASIFVRTTERLELLLRVFGYCLVPACLLVVLAKSRLLPIIDLQNPDDPLGTMAPFGMMVALISAVFLIRFRRKPLPALLGWGTCVALSFASGARIITATLILLPILNPLVKRFRNRIFLAGLVAGLGLALFYTPWFQSRFFFTGHGSLSDVFTGEFDSSGRFDAWPYYWEEAWRHPVLGSGVGSVLAFAQVAWSGEQDLVHNDYLALGFEFGLVGLSLFLGVFLWQAVRLWHQMRRSQGVIRDTFAIALLGMAILALTACTDNPVAYNLWFTDPLFVLIGAAYGVSDATAEDI